MKLKPCPFCGREPHASTDGKNYCFIECGNLDCVNIFAEGDRDETIQRWNTRAEEPAEQKTAHWEINCDGYYPYCSACRKEPPGREMSRYCPQCGAKMVTRGSDKNA